MGSVGRHAYRRSRLRLIETLRAGGISDLAVLHAFDAVPRHLFVPEAVRHRAYEDVALPLGHGQTISRAGVHALHLQLAGLKGVERVLEIGTGSGFLTALLSQLAAEVYSMEVVPEIAVRAADILADFCPENVTLRTGDGSMGWPEHAPYDRILVGAAAPEVPGALLDQLSPTGRMLIPIGDAGGQHLSLVIGTEGSFKITTVDESHFVPLVGEEGW